jgi:hypothetical protein
MAATRIIMMPVPVFKLFNFKFKLKFTGNLRFTGTLAGKPLHSTFALLTRKVAAMDSMLVTSRLMHINTVPKVKSILLGEWQGSRRHPVLDSLAPPAVQVTLYEY